MLQFNYDILFYLGVNVCERIMLGGVWEVCFAVGGGYWFQSKLNLIFFKLASIILVKHYFFFNQIYNCK